MKANKAYMLKETDLTFQSSDYSMKEITHASWLNECALRQELVHLSIACLDTDAIEWRMSCWDMIEATEVEADFQELQLNMKFWTDKTISWGH